MHSSPPLSTSSPHLLKCGWICSQVWHCYHTHSYTNTCTHTHTLIRGVVCSICGNFPVYCCRRVPRLYLTKKEKKFLYFFFLSLLKLHKSCPLGLEVLHSQFFLPLLLFFLPPSPPPATLNSPVVRCPVILSQPGHQAFSIGLLEGLGLIHQTAPLCTFITCSLCCCEHVACNL